nr:triphosphoribosyl-dephospho-CoA synthase [Klebsiella pneumoniae]
MRDLILQLSKSSIYSTKPTQGGMFNPAIEQQLADFNSWCMDKWVSPGGSADLLALCLAMYFLCRQPQGDMT